MTQISAFLRPATLLGLMTVCLLASGCLRREAPADLVIANGNEPESLDPAIVTGISEMRITKALFEGLLRLDGKTGRPTAGWANQWEVSLDGRLYTFHLRGDAAWSTGRPMTAEDVVYSWLRTLSPATAADYAGQLFYIKNAEDFYLGKIKDPAQVGIHALDPLTLKVELNCPLAFFPDLCCFPALAIVPRQTIEVNGDRWLSARPLPSSGPYELAEWRLNDKVRLVKNPRYWDAVHTRSEIIDLLPVGSPNTALNLYETGVADVLWDKDLAPTELMDVVMKRPDFHNFQFLGTCFYRFNVTHQPLNDGRVRRAFALATDRNYIVKKLALGGEQPAFHLVPEGVANYVPPEGLRFNADQARQLLAEAGFPGGRGFPHLRYSFFSAASGGAKMQGKIAVELQQMWREVLGVEIELRQVDRTVFYSEQSRLDFDLSASSWIGDYNDANTFLDLFTSNSGNNRTGWRNVRYDQLIEQANLQADLRRRGETLRKAEELLISEEAPIVPLYFYAGFTMFKPDRIEGIYPNLLDEHPLQDIGRRNPDARPRTQALPVKRKQQNHFPNFELRTSDFGLLPNSHVFP